MPSTHYSAWENHLANCPPGDFLTQRLLAELVMTVEAFMCGFAGKKTKPRTLEKIAPWLVTPAVKAMREKASNAVHRNAALDIVKSGDV